MKKIIKLIAICLITTFGIFTFSPTFAATNPICNQSGVPADIKAAAGCNSSQNNQLPIVIQNILYTIIGVSGLIAIIFVIIGGINYMTSSGDPGKVEKAKKTILYALIGLIICVLAFAIVNFVISQIIGKSVQIHKNGKNYY